MRPFTLIILALCSGPLIAAPTDADLQFFETRIRPLLIDRCYSCHSTTAKKLKGGLYLDSPQGLEKGGDSGPAITRGDPVKSRLITAVEYHDPDLQMPPKDKLPDAQVADLREWIKRGAPWPASEKPTTAAKSVFNLQQRKATHWAWQPISAAAPPPVRNTAWVLSSIDSFILAKLESQNIHPAPPADPATLIRRVYFDLIGLPPPATDVAAFIDDPSPAAFQAIVDRLLASDHFGERWARHWLDLTRYAETYGHEFDSPIPNAWQYRDYVVRAFNADVPYNQFLTEQIAGDLLTHPRLNPQRGFNESILGTGFWFLGEEMSSPVDIRQDEADRINGRLDTITKAFCALTIGCARCHDHKFDAISAKDHYALTGILLGGSYRQTLFESEEHNRAVATDLQRARQRWRTRLLKLAAEAFGPGIHQAFAAGGTALTTEIDHSTPTQIIADYSSPTVPWWQDGFTFGLQPAHTGDLDLGPSSFGLVTFSAARRDAAWPHVRAIGSESDAGILGEFERPGRTLRTPKVTLQSGKIWILMRGSAHIYAAVDTHKLISGPLHGDLLKTVRAGSNDWTWTRLDLTAYAGQRADFEFSPVAEEPLHIAKVIESESTPTIESARNDPTETELAQVCRQMKRDEVRDERSARVTDWMLHHADLLASADSPGRAALDRALADGRREQSDIISRVQLESHAAPAVLEGNGIDENILIRGVAKNPGDRIPRRFLEAIAGPSQSPYPSSSSGRLQLADAMLRSDNPFTARVMANRIWQHLLGRGIVPTVDNFGLLGQPPTHRELLDYLAETFRASDAWSIKKLIRSIVLSRAYQMSSAGDPAADEADPQNLLLHRMPVRRLEAEAIRDEMLAVSGRLDRTVGGPSAEVYLTQFMEGRGRPAASGPLDGAGRRSLYIKVRRNFLSPMMLAFDMPIPFATVGHRTLSNVPAQALILMNDPFVIEQANVWGKRVAASSAHDDDQRIIAMYADAFSRAPRPSELTDARAFITDMRKIYGTDEDRSWAQLAHVLFNVKEFIFIK